MTSLVAFAAAALPALCSPSADAGEPDWQIYTPGSTGVLGDYSHDVFIDSSNRPWVAGYTTFWEQGGMSRLNADGTWTVLSNVYENTLLSPRFNEILEDDDGIMWIATYHGLLRYDPQTGSVQRYDENNTPMPGNRIDNIDFAPDGTLWLAIDSLDSAGPGGLAQFDPATDSWNVWTASTGLPWGQDWPGSTIDYLAITPEAGGEYMVWFGSQPTGLSTLESADGSFNWYGNDWASQPPLTPRSLKSLDPVDDDGNLWLETSTGFAVRYTDGTFEHIGYPNGWTSEVSRIKPIRNGRLLLGSFHGAVYLYTGVTWQNLGVWNGGNHTYGLAEDQDGDFWVSGIGGAAEYSNGSWQRYRITNTGMIGYFMNTIAFDNDGNVYMNGNAAPGVGGFDIFDGERWTNVNDFTYGLGLPWGLPSDDTAVITARSNGTMAIAPAGPQGVYEWDGLNFTNIIPQGADVDDMDEDGTGRLWAVATWPHFLILVDGGYTLFSTDNSPLTTSEILAVDADPVNPGWVWAAQHDQIVHTNGVQWQTYNRNLLGLFQNNTEELLTTVTPKGDGTVWVGSKSGLFHFDPSDSSFTQYTPDNSTLPTDDIRLLEIAPDGSLWIAAMDFDTFPYPAGLSHFDGTNWTTYTPGSSPLPHKQIEALASRTVTDGYELWIGTAPDGVAVITISDPVTQPGDLDNNGVVDVFDLLELLSAWGSCSGACPADITGDGMVNVFDLLELLANWG